MHAAKKLGTLLLCLMICLAVSAPCMAWKVGTHVYSANLILDELRSNNWHLNIPNFGKFPIPDEYRAALSTYPAAFRAGAIGPDGFPDIYVGQAFIHPHDPKTGLISGEWIQHLVNKVVQMPIGAERQQATAFVLGCMMHYAGDLFGHTYVNEWAKGSFPTITDGITDEELKNIIRHNVVEGVIDKWIPNQYKKGSYLEIDAPDKFVYQNLVANVEFKNGLNEIYNRTSSLPKHFDIFWQTRKKVSNGTSSINPLKRKYCEAWIKDIDEGVVAWVATSEKVAQYLLENNTKKAREEISGWAADHLLSMAGFPDAFADMFRGLGEAVDVVTETIGRPLKEKWDEIKTTLMDKIFLWAVGISYTDIDKMYLNPEAYLMDTTLFPAGAKDRLFREMGNFPTNSKPNEQTFVPFYNTLMMCKLVLIGSEQANLLVNNEMKRVCNPFPVYRRCITYNKLTVTIHTSNAKYAGTDDDIHFGIELKDGTRLSDYFDKSGYNDFERGDKDTYTFDAGKPFALEDIKRFWLRKNKGRFSDDDWKCYAFEVRNGSQLLYRNVIDRWFKSNSRQWDSPEVYYSSGLVSVIDSNMIGFVPSLDGSYGWKEGKFVLWENMDYRNKIFNRIFKPM